MYVVRCFSLALILLGLASCGGGDDATSQPLQGGETVYKLYFLGGQSNMEGHGKTRDLGRDQKGRVEHAMIFNGRTAADGEQGGGIGLWTPLSPGYGTGAKPNGKRNDHSGRFGPELTFGKTLIASGAAEKVAIIKYARGGTALVDGVSGYGSWDPDYKNGTGLNQYDFARTAIESALKVTDIDGDGVRDRLVPAGIIWMQGETDAYDDLSAASNYEANLRELMRLLRAALGDDDLPVVIGLIKDSDSDKMQYDAEVKAAQRAFVASDACAALVTNTQTFNFLPDGWHYTSDGYLELGSAFANAAVELEQVCN